MERELLSRLNKDFKDKSLQEAFQALIALDYGKIAFSTSFGLEDQVITDLIFREDHPIEVFTLDTGRLFEETYEVYHRTLNKYNKIITPYFPDAKKVEALLSARDPTAFMTL